MPNKRKIINDPVYGFINIPTDAIYDIMEHRYFQRLRRIKQLGLTYLVYPGAIHTRFQHAIGAMHLMQEAIEIIRSKGHEISHTEYESACLAILLHDIGHGPFSHALEHCIIEDIHHEELSLLLMNRLNKEFNGFLDTAIAIFQNKYNKTFLHQLVSSQLDMDRLDYLKRDSFFTGVSEGVISSDRIIKMLNVVDGNLVVEAKGIYSIEKFLIARRLMYWQVYLHKTGLAADQILLKILKRAKFLAAENTELFCTPALKHFLYNNFKKENFSNGISENCSLELFSQLDDTDIMSAIKVWALHSDKTLAYLCSSLLNRKLFHIQMQKTPFTETAIQDIHKKIKSCTSLKNIEADYLISSSSASNNAYYANDEKINILYNNGILIDIAEASDMFNLSVISKTEKKFFLCYPKEIL